MQPHRWQVSLSTWMARIEVGLLFKILEGTFIHTLLNDQNILFNSSCNEKCPPGKWGVDCEHSCVCNEGNFGTNHSPLARQELAAFCHHETGSCINFHQIIVPSVPKIITTDRFESKKDTELNTSSSTTASILSSSKKSTEADRTQALNPGHLNSQANGYSVDKFTNDQGGDRATGESEESATKLSTTSICELIFDYKTKSLVLSILHLDYFPVQ